MTDSANPIFVITTNIQYLLIATASNLIEYTSAGVGRPRKRISPTEEK